MPHSRAYSNSNDMGHHVAMSRHTDSSTASEALKNTGNFLNFPIHKMRPMPHSRAYSNSNDMGNHVAMSRRPARFTQSGAGSGVAGQAAKFRGRFLYFSSTKCVRCLIVAPTQTPWRPGSAPARSILEDRGEMTPTRLMPRPLKNTSVDHGQRGGDGAESPVNSKRVNEVLARLLESGVFRK
jgi:hypothetical protein